MPLHCPRCQIAQAEENKTCINCGQPLTLAGVVPATSNVPLADPALADHDNPVAPDPVHFVQVRRASWRLPALIAVGLLLALLASVLLFARRRPPARPAPPATAQVPDAVPPVPADTLPPPAAPASLEARAKPGGEVRAGTGTKTAARTTPLTITLASTSEGRHVKVGDAVTFTAFTALARGRSATLTLFYRRGRGQKTMLSFAQGSLCSTTWTPFVPGRYEFTATALGDRQQAAASRHVEVTVDTPAPQTVAQNKAAQNKAAQAPSSRPTSLPPLRTVRLRTVRPRTVPLRTATHAPLPTPALTYHVAAAQFSFSRSAVVLADALRLRGYPAVPERMADPHGKTVYVVVTGSFRRLKEARNAALVLQRSGYPAYFFGSR